MSDGDRENFKYHHYILFFLFHVNLSITQRNRCVRVCAQKSLSAYLSFVVKCLLFSVLNAQRGSSFLIHAIT